jgi:endonuclease III
MPTLVSYTIPIMSPKLHISAERLFAAKGLRQVEESEDESEDESEEEEEGADNNKNKPPPTPATPTAPHTVTPANREEGRPRRIRRAPLPLPLTAQAATPKKRKSTEKKQSAPPAKRIAAATPKTPKTTTPKTTVTPKTPKTTTPKTTAPKTTTTPKATAPKTTTTPKATAPKTTAASALLPDGSLDRWVAFVDAGGYGITVEQRTSVKAWVKSLDPAWIVEQVKFHKQISAMRSELDPSARDAWAEILPDRDNINFDFCCLCLMVATPSVPDTKIVPLFKKLFVENEFNPQWVLDQGQAKLQSIFAPLGRQKDTSKYITAIADVWHSMPRDYRLLLQLPGVGPKVALVTIFECFNNNQGVPCDIHMIRIFTVLGWLPTASISLCDSWAGKEMTHEFARAAIEGWFPKHFWGELNQTWAGLGQLFRNKADTAKMAQWLDRQSKDWRSSLRSSDIDKLCRIRAAYKQINGAT